MLFSSMAMRGHKKVVYLRFYHPAQHRRVNYDMMICSNKKRVPTFISGNSSFINNLIKLNINNRVPFKTDPIKLTFIKKVLSYINGSNILIAF